MVEYGQKPNVIAVVGPTGIGKTALAIEVAEYFQTEILSADSRQCYREMSIGTAKPTKGELDRIQHYFIDSHSVRENVSAHDYEGYGLMALEKMFSKSSVAVVCGGTGLYIKALCEGLDEMPFVDPDVVKATQIAYQDKGLVWLQESVQEEDPLFFQNGEIQNPMRLLRALSFKRSTGMSIIRYRNGIKKDRPFRVIKIGLELPREQLYNQINSRVFKMMHAGLLKEVESLRTCRKLKNLNTVGYTELFDYLDGNCGLEEAVVKIQQHTRNYAKRQMTWFKKDRRIHWFFPEQREALLSFLKKEIYQNC